MATIGRRPVEAVRTLSGSPPALIEYPEAAGQSFKRGEAVYTVNGLLTECSADPGVVLGFAAKDASGVTNTMIGVWIADEDTIFEANVYHGTAASAITVQTLVGKRYGLYLDTSRGEVYIDITSATTRALILKLSPKDVVGDKWGRVFFRILAIYRELGCTS